eukprot:s154_g10.t1
MLVLDFLHLDLLLFLQSIGRIGLSFSTFSCGRLDSSVSLPDYIFTESLMPFHSLSHSEFSLLVLDSAHFGFPLLPQSWAQSGSVASSSGLVRFDFLMSALDSVAMGPFSSLRSIACLDFLILVLDFLSSDFAFFPRSYACLGFEFSTYGKLWIDFFLSSPDDVFLGFLLLPQSSACFEPMSLVLDFLHLGLSLLLRQFLQPGFAFLVFGQGRLEFFLFLSDASHLGPSLLIRSLAHMGSQMLALDPLHLGLPLSIHSPVRTDSVVFALDSLHLDFPPFLHSMAQLDFTTSLIGKGHANLGLTPLVSGLARTDFFLSLSAIDATILDFSLSAHSCVRPGLALLLLDLLHSEPSTLSQSSGCIDPALLVCSNARMELLLFVSEFAQSGLALLLQSSTYLAALVLALDLLHPDSILPVHSMVRTGFVMPMLDPLHPDSFLSLRSLAQLDLVLLALDFLHLDFLLSVQSYAYIESAASAFGFAKISGSVSSLDAMHLELLLPPQSFAYFDSPLFALDFSHSGLSSLARSSSRVSSSMSTLDFLHLGSILSLRSMVCADLPMLLLQLARSEFMPFLLDSAHFDPFPLLHSASRFESALLVLDLLHLDFVLLMRSSVKADFIMSTLGLSRAGFVFLLLVPSAFDLLHPESALLIRSHARLDSAPPICLSALDYAMLGSAMLTQSFVRLGSALFAPQLQTGLRPAFFGTMGHRRILCHLVQGKQEPGEISGSHSFEAFTHHSIKVSGFNLFTTVMLPLLLTLADTKGLELAVPLSPADPTRSWTSFIWTFHRLRAHVQGVRAARCCATLQGDCRLLLASGKRFGVITGGSVSAPL